MRAGEAVVLHGEAEAGVPGVPPGDVVVELVEKPHAVFRRENTDLLMQMRVGLAEALTGFQRPVRLLSGEVRWVRSKPGEVLGTGALRTIPGAGMPVPDEVDAFGDLYIHFEVEFPEALKLSEQQNKQLRDLLQEATGLRKGRKGPAEGEEPVELCPADPDAFGRDPRAPPLRRHRSGTFGNPGAGGSFFHQGEDVQCHQQ
ncbi:unnamed protein product [Heterosigma akashiwo]|uniref:Chaperone DnaJ C-terminal domain-containing protein n=1 Tax=Heterosigma akashiwo TaxID=2829 RepID=A0A7S3Y1W8_HETAK|mmetsp:Transcript_729/g.1257  ORF Transcript_729/g.1257 Transcript_729/m.1257 type:complete len:201 (-) Transcript_729:350-952(-)